MDTSPEASGAPGHDLFFGPDGLRAGWAALTFFAIFRVLTGALTVLAHALRPGRVAPSAALGIAPGPFFANEILLLLAVAVATWVMSRIERRPATSFGLMDVRKASHFVAGLAWGAGLLSLLVLALWKTGLLVFDRRLLLGAAAARYGVLWWLGFLLVALFEEGLMRGYLQTTLARGCAALFRPWNPARSETLGFWTAAALLSALFGLGHRSNPGESRLGLTAAALVGMVFCLSLRRTRSLWWAIGFHAAWDWTQSFLFGVADSGFFVQHRLFATHPVGRPLLSGGTTGPEGSVLLLPILLLAAVAVMLTSSKSAKAGTQQ